jgi:hypothetical protein
MAAATRARTAPGAWRGIALEPLSDVLVVLQRAATHIAATVGARSPTA